MAAMADRTVRFGAYEVDLRSEELRRRGLTVKLQPLPFRVLATLLESPGEVVTREDLQRKLWSGDTYVEFDLGLNAAIKKLRRALGDNPRNPHFIETLPRRGYRFIFPVESFSQEPAIVSPNGLDAGENGRPSVGALAPGDRPSATSGARPDSSYRRITLLVAGLLIAFSLVIRFRGTFDPSRDASVEAGPLRFQARPLFQLRGGLPRSPALSPDGKSVAFTWEGEGQPQGANAHIYVAAIDGGTPRRVTTGTDPEDHASWSPEGRRIAFVRTPGAKARGTYVVSLIDGSVVKVGRYPSGTPPAWTPDGKWLICANGHIWKGSLETREQEQWLPESEVYYHSPAVSPDGKTVAFAGCRRGGSCDVYVRAMEGGEPQRLTFANLIIAGLTWTSDSREIVFSMDGRMYRLPAVAGMQPGRIEFLSRDRVSGVVRHLSLARFASGGISRLVFMNGKLDVDMWATDLSQDAGSLLSGRKLIDSPTIDLNPEYSPDGSKIAFYSVRADRSRELWVCDRDGANPRPVTAPTFRATDAAGPAWSPDSRSIAFRASTPEDPAYHIYTVGLDGGVPKRITDGESEFKPRWSRDGRHIYYCSESKEGWGIWRATPGGFSGLRVDASSSGLGNCLSSYDESPDGRFVYSLGPDGEGYGALWRAPVHGVLNGQQWGKKEKVLSPFSQFTALQFRREGLYFLTEAGLSLDSEVRQLPLRLLDPETGKIAEVAQVKASIPLHFSMSPDGRSVLTNHIETRSAVLMLVDDFR